MLVCKRSLIVFVEWMMAAVWRTDERNGALSTWRAREEAISLV